MMTTTTRHCQHVWLQQSSSLTSSTSSLSTSLLAMKFTCTTRTTWCCFPLLTRYYVFVSFEFSLFDITRWTKLSLAHLFLNCLAFGMSLSNPSQQGTKAIIKCGHQGLFSKSTRACFFFFQSHVLLWLWVWMWFDQMTS
jgi:hypothetical protein